MCLARHRTDVRVVWNGDIDHHDKLTCDVTQTDFYWLSGYGEEKNSNLQFIFGQNKFLM